MSTKALKFTVSFMCKANDVAEFISNTKAFFDTCSSEKLTHIIQLEDAQKHDNEFGYSDELYDLEISIICSDIKRDSDIENFTFAIKKKWCSEARKNKYLMWLTLENQNDISTNFTNYYDNIKASEFAFGTVPTMKIFVSHYRFRIVRSSCVLCSFSHLQRHFVVYISSSHTPECKKGGEMGYKLIVEYINIIRIIANFDSEQNTADLYFHLEHPPLMYVNREQHHDEDSELQLNRISKAKLMEYTSKKFERTFEFGCQCNHTFCKSKNIGRYLVLKISFEDKFQTRWIIEQLSVRCYQKTKIYFTSLTTEKINEMHAELRKFPWIRNVVIKNISNLIKFDCEYAWKTIHTRTAVVLNEIALKQKCNQNYIGHLAQELSSYAIQNSSALVKALFCVADMANKGLIFTFEKALAVKFKYFCEVKELRELPRGMCYVRRVLITPSRTIFLQPFEHFDNRVIRKFGVEYILRVSVQDDNHSKLTYAVHHNSQKESIMEEIVRSKLKDGLVIGFRHYEILASSASQLREHGLWMYAKDPNGNTAASIRKWMGDFSSIKNVAKYMARMGQCFSSTEEGVQITIKNEEEVHLKDIKTQNGRYTFSDGIGTISTALADEVRLALIKHSGATEHENHYKPSAFQIRYKGCKGMVAEIPDVCGRSIGIRPSMKKFECYTSDQLEIVKTSGPRKLYLNKHLITILEQMGVPKENFLDLQIDVMLDMLNSLIDENVALSHLVYNMDVFFPFGVLLGAGISFTAEPFFRSLLLAFLKSYADKLKHNARIPVPEEFGRNMLGVLDETKTLKYGQVFVQYSKDISDQNSDTEILQGPVIVTKNPCLHPGDVRKFTAVKNKHVLNNKHLRLLKDCIVFPAQGKRPHPDEMAGADLDGDEFVVLWHKPLIFQRRNFEPMDYPVYEENTSSKNIEMSDVVDFFSHYIENDSIGTFAHAHLVWADKLKNGIFSEKCLDIAKRYPYVLDFAKHGTTEYLPKGNRPQQYPDFMQKGLTGNSYHSKKALGSLYRTSRVLDACSSKINLFSCNFPFDPHLRYPGWEQYEESTKIHKQNYTGVLLQLLERYNLRSEAEAFSGFVELDICKKWRQEKLNYIQIIRRYLTNLIQTYRNIFFKEVEEEGLKYSLDKEEVKERKYRRASAWYMSLYSDKTVRILSFPWVISDVLAEVRQVMVNKNGNVRQFEHHFTFFTDIDTDIHDCINSGSLKCNPTEPGTCSCINICENILFQWISKSGLNVRANEQGFYCDSCCQRIISHCKSNSEQYCCSSRKGETCKCSDTCSPIKLIMHFLKFLVKNVNYTIGECTESCAGFLSRNLQELSLQTLAYVAITRNIRYFGISFDTNNFMKDAIISKIDESVFEEEGEPIKIPVQTLLLKYLIENYKDQIKEYLMNESGVKCIILRPEMDMHNNPCLIVNSVGKNWHRWNLQKILLDPDFTEKLKENIGVMNIPVPS